MKMFWNLPVRDNDNDDPTDGIAAATVVDPANNHVLDWVKTLHWATVVIQIRDGAWTGPILNLDTGVTRGPRILSWHQRCAAAGYRLEQEQILNIIRLLNQLNR